jgi:3-hydroxyacyl-[acyl-carrier-protein] dehydratase
VLPQGPPYPDVRSVIPHREPFLFIDRVVELGENRIVATRLFRADEPFFAGHFPKRAVVPGVLLVEGLAQTMAYFALCQQTSSQVFLVGIDRARFRSIVEPGQEVTFEVELGEQRLGMLTGRGRAKRDGARVADASIIGYSGDAVPAL